MKECIASEEVYYVFKQAGQVRSVIFRLWVVIYQSDKQNKFSELQPALKQFSKKCNKMEQNKLGNNRVLSTY